MIYKTYLSKYHIFFFLSLVFSAWFSRTSRTFLFSYKVRVRIAGNKKIESNIGVDPNKRAAWFMIQDNLCFLTQKNQSKRETYTILWLFLMVQLICDFNCSQINHIISRLLFKSFSPLICDCSFLAKTMIQQRNLHYKLVDRLLMNYAMNISHLQRLTFNSTANVPRRLPWTTILTHTLTSFDSLLFLCQI